MNLNKGKIPPQAIDLECAVIGAALVHPKAMDEITEVINTPDVFYKQQHQDIFSALLTMYKQSKAIDILTVSEALASSGKLDSSGGDFYLVQLSNKVASGAHAGYHATILKQKFIQRKVISICTEAIAQGYDSGTDVFDLLDGLSAQLDGITDVISQGYSSMSWKDAVLSIPKRVEFLSNNNGEITGYPTGLDTVDAHTSGWQPGNFIVIGADSGMGKTALVMNMMLAGAKKDMPCGMFSMEMPVVQLATRGVAVESQFHMKQLTQSGFEKQEYFSGLNKVVDRLKDLPIHIDDKPALTVPEMKRKARQMKRKNRVQLLVIDFIQMFSGDSDIRLNVSEAARECKNIAKELNIPVIALSQLSREVRRAPMNMPSKHHLKESSAIEEAADIITLIYRPGYYGYTRDNNSALFDNLGLEGDENAALIFAKNRDGSLGNVGMHFIENKTKYVNQSDYELSSHLPQNADGVPF